MEQKKVYRMMEWHRGELTPIMTSDKDKKRKEKRVSITETSAEILNQDFSELRGVGNKIKYVLVETKAKETGGASKKIKDQYYKEFGKKPYHGWTEDQIKEKLDNK